MRTLAEWLAWIEMLYPRQIELGLERVHDVLDKMDLRRPPFAAVTVTGTNGKGSTVAMLEACLRAGGYRVGSYTSPHLVRYNERIRIEGRVASDEELVSAFERIDAVRGTTPLTYFEFGTLAAFEIFRNAGIEVAVLEVGMGGRLDAVNGIDPQAAILTTVGIDHVAWLGDTREAIGREKAGVFRARRPAVCGDLDPPASVLQEAERIGAPLYLINRDFFVERATEGWTWRSRERVRAGLPYPALRGDHQLGNAACVLMALETLRDRFPLSQAHIREGLLRAVVPGRFQVLPGRPLTVLDVAHNAQAAETLAATLRQQRIGGRTLAVFGILRDKAIVEVARALRPLVDHWYLATLHTPRAATAAEILEALRAAGVAAPVETFDDPGRAYAAARRAAREDDRVLVFGSFYMVGDILEKYG